MNFLDRHLLAKAREFLASCLGEDQEHPQKPVVIAYHGDGDGCTAAYFLQRLILRPSTLYWVATPDFDFAKAQRFIGRTSPFLTIFLDMPVYQRPEMIQKLSHQGKVFIYDHHYPGNCEPCSGQDRVFYLNPVVQQDGTAYPTSLFGWEMLSEKGPLEKQILFMGLFTETWLEKIPIFQELSPHLQNLLKEVAKRIHSSFLVQDMSTTHYALNFLFGLAPQSRPEDLLTHPSREYEILDNIYRLVQNEKSWLIRRLRWQIHRLRNPQFILKRVESKMRLAGLIASELRWNYPGLVVGIWQKWKRRFYCELRKGDGCPLNLAEIIHGLRKDVKLTTGGGHPAAAAFTAEGKRFFEALDKLKERITPP